MNTEYPYSVPDGEYSNTVKDSRIQAISALLVPIQWIK
jgi:hypothetical protein